MLFLHLVNVENIRSRFVAQRLLTPIYIYLNLPLQLACPQYHAILPSCEHMPPAAPGFLSPTTRACLNRALFPPLTWSPLPAHEMSCTSSAWTSPRNTAEVVSRPSVSLVSVSRSVITMSGRWEDLRLVDRIEHSHGSLLGLAGWCPACIGLEGRVGRGKVLTNLLRAMELWRCTDYREPPKWPASSVCDGPTGDVFVEIEYDQVSLLWFWHRTLQL